MTLLKPKEKERNRDPSGFSGHPSGCPGDPEGCPEGRPEDVFRISEQLGNPEYENPEGFPYLSLPGHFAI